MLSLTSNISEAVKVFYKEKAIAAVNSLSGRYPNSTFNVISVPCSDPRLIAYGVEHVHGNDKMYMSTLPNLPKMACVERLTVRGNEFTVMV